MDRSCDIRLPGSPGAPPTLTPQAVMLLSQAVAGRNACLIWTGHVDREGYGKTRVEKKHYFAHRAAYETMIGPIPEGMQIDHVCHSVATKCSGGDSCLHRRCINPAHLEAVTPLENSRRSNKATKTHCVHGHLFDGANTYFKPNGTRRCRKCQNEWTSRYRAKRRAVAS